MGPGNYCDRDENKTSHVDLEYDKDCNDNICISVNRSGINNVEDLSSDAVRERLVTHFNILFRQNKIK